MTRNGVLLVTAAECVLLVVAATQWRQVRAERAILLARGRSAAAADRRRLRRTLDVLVRRTSIGRRLGDRLDRAALPVTPGEAVLAVAAVTAAAGWLVSLLLNGVFAVAALVLAPYGCHQVVGTFIRRRAAAMVDQLPALAAALAGAAAAGLSLPSALRLAAEDLTQPVSGELVLALDALSVGTTTEAALRDVARRLPSRELDLLVSTLVIHSRSGGNLVRALRRLTATLQSRRDIRREASSLTSGSTSTAYLMVALGFGIVALMQRSFPGSLDRATGNPVGLAAIAIACGMLALGVLLVRRATRVIA
jgi:tight adherence protein B